jgi:hypothetical protein
MSQNHNNPFEKVLKEFQGTNSWANPRNASSWESNMIRWPHGATTNSGTYERNFFNRAKEEEEAAKAPAIKPYPLDFINDNITSIYEDLKKLKRSLQQSIKYPGIAKEDRKKLQKEIKKVNEMVDNLEGMYYNIEKISL